MTKKKEPTFVVKGDKAEMIDKDGRHHTKIFRATHKKLKSGKLILELTPATKLEQHREDLIKELTGKLKDSIDKEDLMKDVLSDISIKSLEKLDRAVKRGTVKAREGCYNLLIKDPKTKKKLCLPIRK
ncbi:MAG: hypothetical protein KAJ49_05895 [Arcobacteraceae bacterium]|nr:hypothetical protein [Arcobacteraceae bacterium]